MPDFNEDATRVVAESIASDEGMPERVEAVEDAWTAWSQTIQGCDERTMTLLKAAFEAGVEAERRADQSSSS